MKYDIWFTSVTENTITAIVLDENQKLIGNIVGKAYRGIVFAKYSRCAGIYDRKLMENDFCKEAEQMLPTLLKNHCTDG